MLHLSLPVRDLDEARAFYVDVLGCGTGRCQQTWADVWFFGMQITLQERPDEVLGDAEVGVRHLGVTLDPAVLDALLHRLVSLGVAWVEEPAVQYAGMPEERRKAKFHDPAGNVIEVKSYADPSIGLRLPG